jgi:hypothetical protein
MMRTNLIRAAVALGFSILGVFPGCSHYVREYSILESLPSLYGGSDIGAANLDSLYNVSAGLDGHVGMIAAEGEDRITTPGLHVASRWSLSEETEMGVNGGVQFTTDGNYPYINVDGKFLLTGSSLYLGADCGLGGGFSPVNWIALVHLTFIGGADLFGGAVVPYLAPRAAYFWYTWKREYTEGLISSMSYSECPLFGGDAGITLSVPVGDDLLRIKPGVTVLVGREPVLDRVTFNLIQPFLSFQYCFLKSSADRGAAKRDGCILKLP